MTTDEIEWPGNATLEQYVCMYHERLEDPADWQACMSAMARRQIDAWRDRREVGTGTWDAVLHVEFSRHARPRHDLR